MLGFAPGPARVAQMLVLTNDPQDNPDRGEYQDQAAAARQMGLSRSRLARLLYLALLAPDIQEGIRSPSGPCGRSCRK